MNKSNVEKRCCLTISVYPPRRDASQDASAQTRRINLVGLNRRPEGGRVGDKGGCKVCARVHAQIMAWDLRSVLLCDTGFGPTFATGWRAHRFAAIAKGSSCRNAQRFPGHVCCVACKLPALC
jgi:hypothetical protein